jgi:hypothetical protein
MGPNRNKPVTYCNAKVSHHDASATSDSGIGFSLIKASINTYTLPKMKEMKYDVAVS